MDEFSDRFRQMTEAFEDTKEWVNLGFEILRTSPPSMIDQLNAFRLGSSMQITAVVGMMKRHGVIGEADAAEWKKNLNDQVNDGIVATVAYVMWLDSRGP